MKGGILEQLFQIIIKRAFEYDLESSFFQIGSS